MPEGEVATEKQVAEGLPRRASFEAQGVTRDENGNIFFKGKEPKDWSPKDFEDYGKAFGVQNLGPLSPIVEVPSDVAGAVARIPGGLDGKFTYYDLLWLKANPVDVAKLPETTHAKLTAKLASTMAPTPGDKVASFNSIVFGMLSPNAPLLPNEMGQARLRFGSMDEIRKFSELYPSNPTPENLKALNERFKRQLGFIAAGKGGLGIPITADITNIANAARLFVKNPDFFVKRPNESWANFVDKLTTQVKGFGTKTGSFGSVWQDPFNASISAMDRHMARIFGQELLGNPELRKRFDGIVVDRFNSLLTKAKDVSSRFNRKLKTAEAAQARIEEKNKGNDELIKQLKSASQKKIEKIKADMASELDALPDPSATKAKTIDDVLGQAEIYGVDRVQKFVNEAVFAAMGSRKATLLAKKGGINPNAPEHIKGIDWIETPADFQVMSDAYRSALEINERRAGELGIAVFPAQWTLWDRIRQRVEPHEVMFPGLEKLPALNDRQLADAYKANKVAGYMSTPEAGRKWKRSQIDSPSRLAYFMPDQQGFYSKLEEVVNAKLPKVASPQQVLASVDPAKGSGVKPEELKWTGFAQAVERIAKENGGKVPKEKLIEHLKNEGRVRFEEVTTGIQGKSITQAEVDSLERRAQRTQSEEDWRAYENAVLRFESQELGTEAQYSKYQLPGGENYREVVLTSETAAPYTSSHFRDIPFYVAHMRVNERTAEAGKPGLFIEEIQSDRHQQAREKGYAQTKEQMQARINELLAIPAKERTFNQDDEITTLSSNISSISGGQTGIPDAPFRKDWSLQMFKRALRDAVASGKEWIGWTTGETQVDRYDLSKQIKTLSVEPLKDGTGKFAVYANGDLMRHASRDTLSDVVGKEMAQKALSDIDAGKDAAYSGLDLKIGGEGMKGFYDKILPAEVQKYVKQWGSEVKKSEVNTGQGKPTEYSDFSEYQKARKEGQKTTIWRVDITPEMRKSVETVGQPRFMPSDTDYLSAVQKGDTQAAQRMVDEAAKAAGYTVGPVFHRTSAKNITEFRPWVNFGTEEQAANVDLTGRGEGDTRTYKAFLKISNPIRVRDEGMSASNVLQQAREQRVVSAQEMADFPYNKGDDVERAYVAAVLEKNGFDGIVYDNEYEGQGDSYIALKPYQVKLADPVTKDAQGNVIPLSKRFQASSEDIRYMPQPDSAMPGAYSFPGGYRALPGKAKGSLRLYGPAGSLIGIAASLDEAQRIIRRKTRQ